MKVGANNREEVEQILQLAEEAAERLDRALDRTKALEPEDPLGFPAVTIRNHLSRAATELRFELDAVRRQLR